MENNRPLGWTTLEEAKLLVDAGLDPNTADMCYIAKDYIDGKELRWYTKETILEKYGEKAFYVEVLNRDQTDFYPCWSLGALIEISVKITKNDYYFLSSAKDFAYSYVLNSVRELMQKNDNITEATVCFLLSFLKQSHQKKHE